MKNSKILSAIALIGIFFFTACEKEENKILQNSSHNSKEFSKKNKTAPLCSPENALNPYDSAGYVHNLLMSQLESVVDGSDSFERIIDVTDSLIINRYGADIEPILLDYSEIDFIISEVQDDNYISEINTLSISTIQKSKLEELIQIAVDSENECDLIDKVISFEEELLSEHSNEDIENVLIASSIMRYSTYYWDGSNFSTEKLKLWKKIVVVVADVAGGISGGLAGAPTVVGTVAGAIAGAAGGSGGAAGALGYLFPE